MRLIIDSYFMVVWWIVKTIAQGAENGPIHYCSRPKADGNSASGRPGHRGL